jgi:hypothetical protein
LLLQLRHQLLLLLQLLGYGQHLFCAGLHPLTPLLVMPARRQQQHYNYLPNITFW